MLLLLLLDAEEEKEEEDDDEEDIFTYCTCRRRWLNLDDDKDVRNRKDLAVVLTWLSTNMKRHKAMPWVGAEAAALGKGRRQLLLRPKLCGIECRSSWLPLI